MGGSPARRARRARHRPGAASGPAPTVPPSRAGPPGAVPGRRLRRRPRPRRAARRRGLLPPPRVREAVAYALDLRPGWRNTAGSRTTCGSCPAPRSSLGDTPEDARRSAAGCAGEQVNGPRALAFFEQYWGTRPVRLRPGRPAAGHRAERRRTRPLTRHHLDRAAQRQAGADPEVARPGRRARPVDPAAGPEVSRRPRDLHGHARPRSPTSGRATSAPARSTAST